MTPRERLLAVLHGQMPDCVPCCPDISNMVPCRLTGKPFWDIYVHHDPPLWKAYIDALNYFDLDGGFEIYYLDPIPDEPAAHVEAWETRVVHRFKDGSFATQAYCPAKDEWHKQITVFTADNPPAFYVLPEKMGLPAVPTEWEPLTGVKPGLSGMDLFRQVRDYLGNRGVLGIGSGISTAILKSPEDVYAYYDNPEPFREASRQALKNLEGRMEKIAQMNPRPDFLFCGASGSLIFQTPEILRELTLPLLKKATEMAYDLGLPTHVHSCGPEKELVKMAAEETRLTVIDPLEIPPMGDCDLAELKRLYGDRIVLKGNLHTTEVLLRGTPDTVRAAARKAIDDAGQGGRFILSSGDQCGRDTPDANFRAMVETARTYGKYE